MIQAPQGSLVVVRPGTAVQLLNPESDRAVVLIVGAPPSRKPAEYLSDL
jgi:hypothetical protein